MTDYSAFKYSARDVAVILRKLTSNARLTRVDGEILRLFLLGMLLTMLLLSQLQMMVLPSITRLP